MATCSSPPPPDQRPSRYRQVTTDIRERHTGADFLACTRRVARAYPECELHVVLDAVSTHRTPDVQAWLERHPQITCHCTPTRASWADQVETWSGILTRSSIRRDSLKGVKGLVTMIGTFTGQWHEGPGPFHWVRPPTRGDAPSPVSEALIGRARAERPKLGDDTRVRQRHRSMEASSRCVRP